MKPYFLKTPKWIQWMYPGCTWEGQKDQDQIYISFDDGPNPSTTPFILEQLAKYGAKATFFCLGKNVDLWPDLYFRILQEGHQVGNHTQNHLNGWKTGTNAYLEDIRLASSRIDSILFRPPYGRISRRQIRALSGQNDSRGQAFRIIMWNVLSGDFDQGISGKKCLDNVLGHASAGSIVVFHDSDKAKDRMCYSLPGVLEHFSSKGYSFGVLS